MTATGAPSTKFCSKCGREHPLDQFYKNSKPKKGLRSWCKACDKAKGARYRAANAEKIAAKKHQDYLDNMSYFKERSRRFRQRNIEDCLAREREYREQNRDRINAARREAYKEEGEVCLLKKKHERETLADTYVASLLAKNNKLKHADIPQPLIEAKRLQIQIHRLAEEQRHEQQAH